MNVSSEWLTDKKNWIVKTRVCGIKVVRADLNAPDSQPQQKPPSKLLCLSLAPFPLSPESPLFSLLLIFYLMS
jgi:hypothetical protein